MRNRHGEASRFNMGRGIDTVSDRWNSSVESERRATVIRTYEVTGEAGGAHEVGLPCIEQLHLTQTKAKGGDAGRVSASLHESGNVMERSWKEKGRHQINTKSSQRMQWVCCGKKVKIT